MSREIILRRKKMLSIRYFRVILLLLSAAGFVTQVTYVSSQYFAYGTTSILQYDLEESVFNQSVAVCFRVADIADLDRIREETGLNLTRISSLADAYKYFSSLTIKQMFDYTPNEKSSIIKFCVYRLNRWQIREATGSECDSNFNISRFYMMESMCYRFEQAQNRQLTNLMVDHSPLYRAVFYRVSLDSRFDHVDLVSIIVYAGGLPYLSREYSHPLPRFKRTNSAEAYDYNQVYTTATYLTLKSLPPPYITQCRYATEDAYFVCMRNCLLEKYKAMDKIPATEIWEEAFQKKAFIATNETDEQTVQLLTQYQRRCHLNCHFKPCSLQFSITVALVVKEDIGSAFGFTVMTPNDPDVIVTAKPAMTLIDYLTFIGSCFGTWFGASFLSLDPMSRRTRRRRRRRGDFHWKGKKLFEPSPNGMGIHIYVSSSE